MIDVIIIILSLVLTAFSYMIFPFIKFHKTAKQYTIKEIRKILILNSIIVELAFILLSIIIEPNNYKINFAPAFFYYILNSVIWRTKKKNLKLEQSNKECKNNKKTEQKKKILLQKNKSIPLLKSILICSIITNIIFISMYIITIQKNKKYIKTINYLIDDNFVKAEKYINNNKLYSNINYKLLVKKINNKPIQRLNQYSKTGLVIDWDTKYTCKRFITDADICKKPK